MSVRYPVPFGFLPMAEARERARLEYSHDPIGRMVGMLIQGALRAWLADQQGEVTAIEPAFWRDAQSAERAILKEEVRTRPVAMMSSGSEGRPVFREVDLNQLLPSMEQRTFRARLERLQAKPARQTTKRQGKGGHPEEFDWEAMWIEIVRIMRDEGMPAKSVDLRKRMQAWFGDHQPTDNTIRPKIERLFERLSDPDQEAQQ